MTTIRQLARGLDTVPLATSWLLQELAEERGRQEKFEWQAPERLERLRQSAIVESAVSSNRMEGVEIAADRVAPLLIGNTAPRDRNEQEIRGYRDALDLIHGLYGDIIVDEAFLMRIHRDVHRGAGDAGEYKQRTEPIIERHPNGSERIRFMPVDARTTPGATRELLTRTSELLAQRQIPGLVVVGAFNLDFLCIHPFRDGNGRTSRLLLLRHLYQLGFHVGRYVSLERIIEQSKDRYYETLEQSSTGWHEERHDPWPLINYLLYTVREAYREFVERVGEVTEPRGTKTARVNAAINRAPAEFTLGWLESQCPGVSRDLLQMILRERPDVRAARRGPNAPWRKL